MKIVPFPMGDFQARSCISQAPRSLRKLRGYRAFSHDFTAAILVFQDNETAAMLVYPENPLGVELFSHVNVVPIN